MTFKKTASHQILGILACGALTLSTLAFGDVLPPAPKCPDAGPLQRSDMAPADEYFGKQKMSILEMRNRIRDLSQSINAPGLTPESKEAAQANAFHWAGIIEDSLGDLDSQYPKDPSISRTFSDLAQLYFDIGTGPSQEKGKVLSDLLFSTCPVNP
jgi:hypothetical protein